MRDSVITTLRIVHGKREGVSCLPADVAKQELVTASVDSLVAFAAPVLEGGNGTRFFGVGEADLAYVFVIDLKLWVEQLHQSHFVCKSNIRFLKNFHVGDCAP